MSSALLSLKRFFRQFLGRFFGRFFLLFAARFLALLLLFCASQGAFDGAFGQSSDRIGDIVIEGAQRSDPASIFLHLPLRVGDRFDEEKMDRALKNLHATGRFDDVVLLRRGRDLVVIVKEAPIVNRIAFEGNKAVKDAILESETSLLPLQALTKARVNRDVERLLQLYRRYGRFAANIRPRIIRLDSNRVNLVYEISEGKRTKIRRIAFLGNRSFSRRKLLKRLYSRQSRFYRILGRGTYYEAERFAADRQVLENFYRERGFARMRVVGASAELSRDRQGFVLTMSIEEGKRYRLRDIGLTTAIDEIDQKAMLQLLKRQKVRKGNLFRVSHIEAARVSLLERLGEQGLLFVKVDVAQKFDAEEGKADLLFSILRASPQQVSQVEIVGNNHTLDRIIRREISLSPGDALQTLKIRQSVRRLQRLGYFEAVEPEIVETSDPQRVVVRFHVKERPTGKIEAGAGYSTQEAFFGQFSFGESNFRGRGQKFDLTGTFSKNTQKASVAYAQRYLARQPLNPSVNIAVTNQEKRAGTAYGAISVQVGTGIALDIGGNWVNSWNTQYKYDTIKDLEIGTLYPIALSDVNRCPCHELSLGYAFTYSSLNDPVNPHKGQWFRFLQNFADFGTTSQYVRSEVRYLYYQPVYKGSFLKFDALFANISSLGKPLRITDRYRNKIRGFRLYGTGALDKGGTAVGNDNFAKTSLDFSFPVGLPKEVGIRGFLFVEAALPFGLDLPSSLAEDINYRKNYAVRASWGGGILWTTPVGPLQFTFTSPIAQADSDALEFFAFTIGTRF